MDTTSTSVERVRRPTRTLPLLAWSLARSGPHASLINPRPTAKRARPHNPPHNPRGNPSTSPSAIEKMAPRSQNSPANPTTTDALISSPLKPPLASLNIGFLEQAMSLAVCRRRVRSVDSSISDLGLLITRIPVGSSEQAPEPLAALTQLVLHRLR